MLGHGVLRLHKGQWRGLNAPNPIVLLVGGIRSGKTHVGALKTILRAINQPCGVDEYHAVVSPTYPMSSVPVDKIFSLLYDQSIFPVCPLIEYSKRDRVFVLKAANGTSKIKIFSMHQPHRIRGFKILSVWYDEGSYGSLESWRIIQGRVADTSGHILVTTTPAGYNWVYDIYAAALEEKRKGVSVLERTNRVIHFTSLDNPFIQDMDGFNRLLGSYDEKTYQQEVLARFMKATGLVYYAFNRHNNIASGTIDPALPLWIGQDFNVAKMASSIAQPMSVDGQPGAWIKGERLAANSNTESLINWCDRFIEQHRIPKERVTFFPDASGKARSTSGVSDFELLRKAGYRVSAPESNPFVRDRVNNMNSLFKPAKGKARLVIDPRCTNHIESLEKQCYDDHDPPAPDKKHGFDHIMDACGYFIWRKLPLRGKFSLGGVPQTRRAA